MKKLYAPIIILFIAFFIASNGYCQDEKIRVYFGNGVFNNEKEANKGLSALQEILDNSNIQGDLKGKIACEVSYNPSDGILDLFETIQQSNDLVWSAFWDYLTGIKLMPDFFLDKLKEVSVKYDEDMIKSYPSIQQHIAQYNNDLCQGDKVVVVAHSQGNLYANIAYKGINEDLIDGFGIVSVANPSGDVEGDSFNTHTTLYEDVVIKIIPWALGPNVDNFPDLNPNDLSGHMFIKSYLAQDLEAESRILDHMISQIYTL